MRATGLYNEIIWELRRFIFARGLTMQQCDDLTGNQDGYTAKMLHPETNSGRMARWETIENLVEVLMPMGFKIRINPVKQPMPNGFGTMDRLRSQGVPGRLPIRDYARVAGLKSWEIRKQSPKRWSAFCSRAAKKRWKTIKIQKARGPNGK